MTVKPIQGATKGPEVREGLASASVKPVAAPRFSVVIPCYNQGAFLAECLASLRAQTLAPHEIIVVDDGSTDEFSVRRMQELCVDGVRLIRQENRGLSGARNTGIRASTGDWILPLDADDMLLPEAIATYSRAVMTSPEVDVWYPDLTHFGHEDLLWECPPFNPWRLLWGNDLICSSAIRRTVFDSGVFYNERMRQGYEDWEFFIHACVERGHLARSLEHVVFRYRRWGYSMLSESNSKRAQLIDQLHHERAALYGDEERLTQLKRRYDPYLAIAATSTRLRPELERQTLRDFQVVDETNRVTREGGFAAFQRPGPDFARMLVSVDDDALGAALGADRFLLEKVARVLEDGRPPLLWLVTADAGEAYPGFLVKEHEVRDAGMRCVGFAVDPLRMLEGPPLARGEDGLLEDLEQHMRQLAPGAALYMVVGPSREPGEGLPCPLPLAPSLVPAHGGAQVLTERKRMLRESFSLMGRGASKLLRGAIGANAHDKLLSSTSARRLRAQWLGESAPMPAQALPAGATELHASAPRSVRAGPFAPWRLHVSRQRNALYRALTQKPRFEEGPLAGADTPALLVMVSWMVHGGVERAVVDLLQGLHRIAPRQRRYVLATINDARSVPMAWADEVLACVDGVFSVDGRPPRDASPLIASLVERLNVGAVLVANSKEGFDALPLLREQRPELRVISQAHTFPCDPVTGEWFGHCPYSATRYDAFIDAYASISRETATRFTEEVFVSPTKVRLVPLGVDTERFGAAHRERFAPGERPRVLWLGRLAEEKDPLMCLRVARLWKERHGADKLGFHLVGSGPEEPALRAFIAEHRLSDVVTLQAAVNDPVPQYRAADCLMMTSRYEGIPLVIYEAMAAGLPVVASIANTSIPDVLPAELSWHIHQQSEAADYVAALEQMLADPELARARAERMRQASTYYGRERYARETLELLFPEPQPQSQAQPLRRVAH
ncbi:glycosyltransferase [Myxococcus stipitatus]|uniref:glycosyltransferase n=1 Tax=Myxococcus stipitatus TaxID=83455 RepID=UPI001F211774|nr:glycosyltransferase [Myxococcus stipitatus]MCE9668507.1 glycosyltransferase [Myxococcus stipitatus]